MAGSPMAITPLPKSSVAPETPSKEATASPETVPFPPPQTFEIIAPLHGILLRLLSQKTPSDSTGVAPSGSTGAQGASTDAPSRGQPGLSNVSGNGTNNTTASQAINLNPNEQSSLDMKNLPTETNSIKVRIQKARAVVEGLPDVHRSIDEQQTEIVQLEDRVARLQSVISDFGSRAAMD